MGTDGLAAGGGGCTSRASASTSLGFWELIPGATTTQGPVHELRPVVWPAGCFIRFVIA